MDSYQIMKCVAICLRRIQINDDAVDSLIPDPSAINSTMNMSIKYKLANQLSTCIQVLYCCSDIEFDSYIRSIHRILDTNRILAIKHFFTVMNMKFADFYCI